MWLEVVSFMRKGIIPPVSDPIHAAPHGQNLVIETRAVAG
jgi:hypothetical protein